MAEAFYAGLVSLGSRRADRHEPDTQSGSHCRNQQVQCRDLGRNPQPGEQILPAQPIDRSEFKADQIEQASGDSHIGITLNQDRNHS